MTKKQKRMRFKIILTMVFFVIVSQIHADGFLEFALFLFLYILIGSDVVKKAFINIKNGRVFDEHFLMTVATFGAFGCNEYPEAVSVMLFYQVGEFFQSIAVGKSRKSIADLMDICPEFAVVVRNGEEIEVFPDEVLVGEEIIIKAGERVPLDGIILQGNSSLDTKALTGEAIPRDVGENDEIISGCINITGFLRVKVTKIYQDSTVARILELVENASDKKSKVENFITKFARYYTPIVVYFALALAIIPSILTGEWSIWVVRALSFLVVSCPCALVISVPLSFFGGIGACSRRGILVKGSNFLEALALCDTIVFDKTGTITTGKFTVSEVHSVLISDEQLLDLATLVEHKSNHPISKAIVLSNTKKLDFNCVSNISEIAGQGMSATIENEKILVGNAKLMHENNIDFSEISSVGTVIYVAKDQKYCGYIIISDEIRKNAQETISKLKNQGIKKCIMLSGDTKKVVQSVASNVGIDEFYANLLPQDKVLRIEEILSSKNENQKVIFVGDGINDAPVLTRADVGIAMGEIGSDSAIEASDIVLTDDNFEKISQAISISRKTMRIVKQNIAFILSIKLIVLILSAFGITGMWSAVFADVGVSVIAILNAQRMLHNRL